MTTLLLRTSGVFLLGACALAACAPPMILVGTFSAVQTGAAAYINGQIKAAYSIPFEQVLGAADEALAVLEYPVRSRAVRAASATLLADEIDGRDITIIITKRSERVTKIRIRVGTIGDQVVSRLILAEIQNRLIAERGPIYDLPELRPAGG